MIYIYIVKQAFNVQLIWSNYYLLIKNVYTCVIEVIMLDGNRRNSELSEVFTSTILLMAATHVQQRKDCMKITYHGVEASNIQYWDRMYLVEDGNDRNRNLEYCCPKYLLPPYFSWLPPMYNKIKFYRNKS